jgi:hypothetical protein
MTEIKKRLNLIRSDTFNTQNSCEINGEEYTDFEKMKEAVLKLLKLVEKSKDPEILKNHKQNINAYLNCVTNKSR